MDELKDFVPFGDWLSKKDLIVSRTYFCRARNFKYGTWNGVSFDYTRTKWNKKFKDTEYHWDDGPPYGTVKPLKLKARS